MTQRDRCRSLLHRSGSVLQNYDLLVPARTVFGWGRLVEVGGLARALGEHALIVNGSRKLEENGTLGRLGEQLEQAGVTSHLVGSIHREPRVSDVDALTDTVRSLIDDTLGAEPALDGARSFFVVGIGGGAALDLAKAITATATNRHLQTVRDALEGVGRDLGLKDSPLPMLAIPTTAGTGSECTKNSVISSDDDEAVPFKKSLRSDRMVPELVLVDPELTVTVPPDVTARTGMDAITQLIESLISCRAKPITSALARHGLELAVPMIERAVLDPADREARSALAHGAYLSGITLANAGLGLAHGVAPALGIHCGIPHGLACAIMLPEALDANRDVREADIGFVGRLLTGRGDMNVKDAARAAPEAVRELNDRLGIPRQLGDLGVRLEQIPAIVKGSRGNSMSGNPRPVSDDELTERLEAML